ncbi:Transcription factor bHLH30 [Linum grandiflorum]
MIMCGLKEEDIINNNNTINLQQQHHQVTTSFHQMQHQQYHHQATTSLSDFAIPPPPWGHQYHHTIHDQFMVPPPPPPPPSYGGGGGGFFNRGMQFAYDSSSAADHLRIISETLGPVIHPGGGGGGVPFGLQAELGKMSAQEIMDAKALAASKSHSEAERRRRERINNHLAKLRSLLPSTTKTDKASLLAEVIQHVKELKRQTNMIAETTPIPTESDELTVDATNSVDEDGKFVIKASLCCEDRSDLLPDLIRTLKSLRLRTLKAEITTLGGRVKNVLFITADQDDDDEDQCSDEHDQPVQYSISSIHEALKAVMEKGGGGGGGEESSSSGSVKRQRTTNNDNNVNMMEQQQQQLMQHHHMSL